MSHRIESPYATDARLARIAHAHPSPPPPIATLPQSPSLSSSSLDRSSVSSPAPTRRGSTQSVHLATSYNGDVCYPGTESDRPRTFYQPSAGLTEPPYRVQPRTEPRYVSAHDGNPRAAAYPPAVHVVPSQISGGAHDLAYHYPGQHQFNAIYTDDATTKLNDRIRRRCFNCCTTDTSTWRRSSLNPGKVLCNKCGLFERTHNRARPEQFPHKRGPLATSSLKVRTSPPQHGAVPPVSALPPHQYNHPSIAPLLSRTENAHATSRGDVLPQIQSWLPPATTPAGKLLLSTEILSPLSDPLILPQRPSRTVLAARDFRLHHLSFTLAFPLPSRPQSSIP
ncbi:hypothetical protein BJY52DRAFT_84398 [Lactarius psammicola]|nr:hypothetical protein BJY52DRAFT_84398 [Lactarius psammicola]